MEAVGLPASIAQLVSLTTKTIKYLNSVRDAQDERTQLYREASSLLPLLVTLQTQVEEAKGPESWLENVRVLGVKNGPLDQLKDALEQLAKKLKPKKGVKEAARALIWTLDKGYCQDVLQTIERVKSRITLALQGDALKLARAIKADTAGIAVLDERVSGLAQNVDSLRLKGDANERENMLGWLSPLNFLKTQQDIFSRRQEGTGQWLIDSTQFQNWVTGSERIMCCSGIPGAGKSILASFVVDFLRNTLPKEHLIGIAAVYCNFKERDTQTLDNLLAGLCMQLTHESLPLPDALVKQYHAHHSKGTRPSLEGILQIFEEAAKSFGTVYLVIDALDECLEEVRNDFIPQLKSLPLNVKLLVTTRFVIGVTNGFKDGIKLEIRANHADMEKYIRSRIKINSRLERHTLGRTTLVSEICDSVIAKAEGMFLAAKLHVDSLSSKTSVKALKTAIQNLSSKLDDLYDDALRRIDSQSLDDRELAEKALRWVAYTYRPLDVKALLEALALETGQTDFDPEAIPPMYLVLDVCAGLLVYDKQNQLLRLVHYTAQDYFDRLAESRFKAAHNSIARECITYLSYDSLQSPGKLTQGQAEYGGSVYEETKSAESDEAMVTANKDAYQESELSNSDEGMTTENNDAYEESELSDSDGEMDAENSEGHDNDGDESNEFPEHTEPQKLDYYLLPYASTFWGLHAMATPEAGPVIEVEKFLACDRAVCLRTPWDYDHTSPGSLVTRHGYQIAAFFGLCDALEHLLQHTRDINELAYGDDWRFGGHSALHLAAWNNQMKAAEILLQNGADIECRATRGMTPLHVAIEYESVTVAQALVEKGANVMAKDGHGRTPVPLVCWDSPTSFLQLLVRAGAKINIRDIFDANPLMLALIGKSDIETAEWLAKVSAFSTMDSGRQPSSALFYAAVFNSLKFVDFLLRYGPDLDSRDSLNVTALHQATLHGNDSVMRLLLDADAQVDALAYNGRTALHLAAIDGHGRCLELLLRYHANIDKSDKDGRTPLMAAILEGHTSVAQVLLYHNANLDIRDKYGSTAIHLASAKGDAGLVNEMLKLSATVDLQSSHTLTLKFINLDDRLNYYDISEIINITCNDTIKAFSIAPAEKNDRRVPLELVQQHKKCIECKIWENGMTALDIAAVRGDEEIMRLLEPLTDSKNEAVSTSFNEYLCEVYEVSSVDEVEEEWQRRRR
ncbi:MAG: hypothetical protein Q9201_006562 [Fulgogasparrea decipioides]